MNEELKLAWQLRRVLDAGTETLDERVCAHLVAARQQALARARCTNPHTVGIGGRTLAWVPVVLRSMLAALALVIGVAGSWYWNNFQQAERNEAIDSALLADELPIDAYLDRGFHAWLARQSASASASVSPLQ